MHKSGFINIIGNPNVGKSTLMNNLIGEKLSIITSKAQTTRHRILGIVNGDNFQLIFSDTPGIIKPSYELQDSMMDFVKSALEDAEKNADFNNIENVQFLKANLDTYFKSGQLPKKTPRPDVVIVDPPRAGMHPDMTQYLPKLKAEKIVYVSCNPTTQARDAKILHEKGYKINKAVMVDMFPHTPHIENIVLFSK